MAVIDETSGPGKPVDAQALYEIWRALGHPDGRVPLLDEVLIEIRTLVDVVDGLAPDTDPSPRKGSAVVEPSVTMTFTGPPSLITKLMTVYSEGAR